MLQLSLQPIATGEIKKAPLAQEIFNQTESFDPAQRARILTQLKRACDIAMNEITVTTQTITNIHTGEQEQIDFTIADLALIQVREELETEGRECGKTFIDGAPYTVNVKETMDFNADNGKSKDEPKLIEHPKHEAVKNWHKWDDLQAELKAQSATCTRKKADAVKDYREAYPDAKPTSVEYTLSIGD